MEWGPAKNFSTPTFFDHKSATKLPPEHKYIHKHLSKKNSGFQNFIFFQKKTAAHTLKQSEIDLFLHILAI